MQNIDSGKETCLLLERKQTLFSQYLSTTEKMKAALGNNEESNLEQLLSTRQDLIYKIEKIDLAIKRTMPTSPDRHNLISEKFKELIANLLNKLKSIMERVEPLDKELMAMVQQEGESTKTSLLRKQKVRQAMRGYGSFNKYPAKFLDTRR